MARFRPPVEALPDGAYRVSVGGEERRLLRGLCGELRALVEADDAAVGRLFPDAFRDDPEASADYDRLVRGDLVSGRVRALRTVEETIDAERLDESQAEAWCGALNDLRLVLGERLGVTEDVDVERYAARNPDYALYAWLTWLQGHLVEALASRL